MCYVIEKRGLSEQQLYAKGATMTAKIAIGIQDFEKLRKGNYFYVDKTQMIQEWWESGDDVTLITRPRRFGKTLNMSMIEQFFSVDYAERADLFEGLSIWKEEEYRALQGSYPVISLSFARVKDTNLPDAKTRIHEIISSIFNKYSFLKEETFLSENEQAYVDKLLSQYASDVDVTSSLHRLSEFLYRYYGKKVLILLDEYDTPMQEAYIGGYWEELVGFMRNLFNSTFKTNPCMERGLMTGITRVSKESIFSDLNNLKVVTTTSESYATAFGFTEQEVFATLEKYGLSTEKEKVKFWYDGFIFGKQKEIYNPWSILNFLDEREYSNYWANTSSNGLIGKLLREGDKSVKEKFETLLRGETLEEIIDEQIVYNQLDYNETAIWSLLLASGYLKVVGRREGTRQTYGAKRLYELAITNFETKCMFEDMVLGWFGEAKSDYNDFIKALLLGDIDAMNEYMSRVARRTFSYFDVGNGPLGDEPERFYHGFVLGLLVELQNRYVITSNRESGFGRYDVMLEPLHPKQDVAVILEFKAKNKRREKTLEETLEAALEQIAERQYVAQLEEKGIPKERIFCYGIVFEGKTVLVG